MILPGAAIVLLAGVGAPAVAQGPDVYALRQAADVEIHDGNLMRPEPGAP